MPHQTMSFARNPNKMFFDKRLSKRQGADRYSLDRLTALSEGTDVFDLLKRRSYTD